MSAYDTERFDRMEPGYLNSYGLREAPFSPDYQDKFLYLDAERAQCLNLLQHMTQYSNLLLIVQGERGAGKTSLMTRFINNAENEWRICQVTANTMMDAEQLLFQSAQGFGLDELPRDASQLQELLYNRVAAMHHNNEIPILIIDDAHELPKDALLAIFNLADTYVDEEHLLRIILFCEPQIEKIFNTKDVKVLRERVTHTMDIPALDEELTAEYLKHRLAVAGFSGGSPFTPKMIKRIYRASRGLPGMINELANETLEHGDFDKDESEEPITVYRHNKPRTSIVLITAAIVLFTVVLLFQGGINRLSEDEPSVQQDVQPVDIVQNINPASPDTSSEVAQVPVENLQKKIIPLNPQKPAEEVQSSQPAETVVEKSADIQPPDPVAEQTAITETAVSKPAEENITEQSSGQQAQAVSELDSIQLYSVKPDPITANGKVQTIAINGQGFTPRTGVVVGWSGKEKKLSAGQIRVESETQIKIDINVGRTADTWNIRVVDPKKGKSNLLGFQVTAAEDISKGNKWVLARNPEAFTLQLFGTNLKHSADKFREQHAIQSQSAWFYTQRDGRDWYSVVYGEFPDQDAARQAISILPPVLQKLKPWVRRFDDIHASINASRKVAAKPATKPTTTPTRIPLAATPILKDASAEQHASWLWSQDPSNFTLQLLGARQSNSISRFLRKYSTLNGKAVYFHTRHEARDWYTVVYGVYPDRESATKAIDRLPPELKKSSPWVRSFASIHAEMDRAE